MSDFSENERRLHTRKDLRVTVEFNFHGHEKLFNSVTKNISCSGMFVEAPWEFLNLLHIGISVIALLEYETNFLIRLTGYVIRIENSEKVEQSGFAVKFLELNEEQIEILSHL